MNISLGNINVILHDHLGVCKRFARWVPLNFNDEQKKARVECDGGRSNRPWDIVAGDETWVCQYDPEIKQQSAVWIFPGENPPCTV